jgi:hypothetical protein
MTSICSGATPAYAAATLVECHIEPLLIAVRARSRPELPKAIVEVLHELPVIISQRGLL